DTVIGAEFSRDPLPNFHDLIANWPSAELYVPTIGGGTANVEFEVMSGMNMDFFGAGEAPYNTIIRDTTCETIAHTLRDHGFYTSALHHNTGAFFNRYQVYANLGYDRFDCLEYMTYPKYNYIDWAHDTILTGEIMDIMENSVERDLIFAIGVESHGKYPETYEYTEGDIEVLSLPEGAYMAPFQNYVNVIDEVDDFVEGIITSLEAYDEPTVAIIYGDHLPALGLEAEMLTTGDLYASKYVIWNNYGADFEAVNMQAYRLSAELLRQLGISGGILPKLHQSYPIADESEEYMTKLQTLEYDLLYGKKEAYGEKGPYEPTDIHLGVNDITIESAEIEYGRMLVTGDNFTEFSKLICGGNVMDTVFIDKEHIAVPVSGETVIESFCVAQINADGKEIGRTEDYVF
ncbi:MAG: LTA synthase family protein, partial [Clostridia bacterium]|nr:LTA synthase family protein [Clostridia bacterium]